MSATGDVSPSRGNGLSHVLSKARRGHSKKSGDTNSTVSDSSDGHHGIRASLEGAIDKHEDGEHSGLGKLIPKAIGSKRRRKRREKEAEERDSEEAARGRGCG